MQQKLNTTPNKHLLKNKRKNLIAKDRFLPLVSQSIEIESSDLGIDLSALDLVSDAQDALASMQDLIDGASSYRGYLGSQINRLEKAVEVTEIETENALEIASKISNTDIATETATYTSNLIMAQMAIAIQIQANLTQERTGQLLTKKKETKG